MKKKKKNINKINPSGYSKIRQSYFINGKQKFRFVEYMDGIPIYQWYENNVDIITAFQDGYFEKLVELRKLNHPNFQSNPTRHESGSNANTDENDLPF